MFLNRVGRGLVASPSGSAATIENTTSLAHALYAAIMFANFERLSVMAAPLSSPGGRLSIPVSGRAGRYRGRPQGQHRDLGGGALADPPGDAGEPDARR